MKAAVAVGLVGCVSSSLPVLVLLLCLRIDWFLLNGAHIDYCYNPVMKKQYACQIGKWGEEQSCFTLPHSS